MKTRKEQGKNRGMLNADCFGHKTHIAAKLAICHLLDAEKEALQSFLCKIAMLISIKPSR